MVPTTLCRLILKEGIPGAPGVNPRALRELFKVAEERKDDYTTEISVSVLEIYMEQIRDLLATTPSQRCTFHCPFTIVRYEIKQGPEGMYVTNTTWIPVNKYESVEEIVEAGSRNR